MNGIDPKWGAYLGLAVIIEQGIGHGTVSLTNLIPADWAPYVTSWANFLAFVGTSIMTYQAAVSGPQKGPLADIPISPAVKAAAILALALGLLAFPGGSAMAATPAPAAPAPAKCALIFDPLKLCGLLTGNLQTDTQRVVKRIAAVSKADLNYAMAKAKVAGTPASKVRLQCIQAISDANDQFNGVGLKNPDGTEMKRPDPALITDIEDVAELVDNLSPQGVLLTSCAGAAKLLGMNALAAVNGIVTGAASFATVGVGL